MPSAEPWAHPHIPGHTPGHTSGHTLWAYPRTGQLHESHTYMFICTMHVRVCDCRSVCLRRARQAAIKAVDPVHPTFALDGRWCLHIHMYVCTLACVHATIAVITLLHARLPACSLAGTHAPE